MVSGVERYYQLARCYRDEDFRADRQPEFTQLDMEMAYVDQEDVMAMTEKVIAAIWKSAGYEVQLPLPRITWKDAMDKYGSDKPDLRFGNPLVELTEYFKNTPFRVFQAVVFKWRAGVVSSTSSIGLVSVGKRCRFAASSVRRLAIGSATASSKRGAKGLAYVVFGENGELSPAAAGARVVAKNLDPTWVVELFKATRSGCRCRGPPCKAFTMPSRLDRQVRRFPSESEPTSSATGEMGGGLESSPPAKACWIRRSSLSCLRHSRTALLGTAPCRSGWDDDVAVGRRQLDLHAPAPFTMPPDWID